MSDSVDPPIAEAIPRATAFEVPGYEVAKHPRLTSGVLVRSVRFAKGFTGGFKALRAGGLPQCPDVVDQTHRHGQGRPIANAPHLVGNSVIGVRFGSSMTEIFAYGAAVVVEPKP